MTVKEFVDGYKSGNTEYTAKELVTKAYIPAAQKLLMSQEIVRITSYKMDNKGDLTDEAELKSPLADLYATMYAISEYTNIDVNLQDAVNEFDLLAEAGLVDYLVAMLPNDADRFMEMVTATKKDFIKNHMSMSAVIDKGINRITNVIKEAAGPILDGLEKALAEQSGLGADEDEVVKAGTNQ